MAVGLLVLLLVGCRDGDGAERYVDQRGWSIDVPHGMYLERSGAELKVSIDEVTVASFPPRKGVHSFRSGRTSGFDLRPPRDAGGRFPTDGVALRIVYAEGGPPGFDEFPGRETRFPLRLADLRRHTAYPGSRPGPRELDVTANGSEYAVFAWVGPRAAPPLRDELARVLSSLAFPPVREGQELDNGDLVLGPAERYPLRSFTRLRARGATFYLVHAPGGLYAIEWRGQSPGAPRCRLELDEERHEFRCAGLHSRWDRVGRVLVGRRGVRTAEPLTWSPAAVTWDGHVLLLAESSEVNRRLAVRLWPGWYRG